MWNCFTATGTITVNDVNTAAAPSTDPTLCVNSGALTDITIATTGATGIGYAYRLTSRCNCKLGK